MVLGHSGEASPFWILVFGFWSFSLQHLAFSLIFNVPGTYKMTGIVLGT